MNTQNNSITPQTDQEQYLLEFDAWSEDWATQTARELGYSPLSWQQWTILRVLRDQYRQHGTIPNPHQVCKTAGLEHFCLEKYFHNNGAHAWKLAGLPNPGEEIKSYL